MADALARLQEITDKHSEQIAGLAANNATQNEQIKTLFNTTKAQGETINKQADNQMRLINRLVMAILGVFVIVVLALVFGALGERGFNAVTKAAPSAVSSTVK